MPATALAPALPDTPAEILPGLAELIAHVLIHEIGHHFGLSDDDIHAIEDDAD